MFLAMPDDPASRASLHAAVDNGLRAFRQTLGDFPRRRDLSTFLIANMFYIDGLGVIVAFGGIYATALFGWGRSS